MSKNSKTLFITGSKGFIGRNLVNFFENEYEILAPDHKELDLLCQEGVNKFFDKNEIDYVIHCANVGGNRKHNDTEDIIEKNVRMFFNLAENNENFEKMINLGTGAEYSKCNMKPNIKESEIGKFIPEDYYGFSKYIITKSIENTNNIYSFRLFGIFGPHEDYSYKFISNSILKNFLKLPITIMQNVYFDWLYIDDLMSIMKYFLLNNPSDNIYNVTSGKTIDIVSIAKIINNLSDFESQIEVVNKGLNREYSGSNRKLLDEIGKYEFIEIENSIKRLRDYYKLNIDKLDLKIVKQDPYASKCKIN